MNPARNVIVTLAYGKSPENLDYTFSSFARCPQVELHAFILGRQLPRHQTPGVQYHLLKPLPDFSHPLREVYFRRMEVLDELGAEYALTVDSFDVLCLQPLPPLEQLLGNADVAGCVEHMGSRYVLGQGYTSNFLNGGVILWNVPRSRDIRAEIVARGRAHFRTIADDQFCLNEVIQTKYFDRLRLLPCQYNYRAYLKGARGGTKRGWPVVDHLDGIVIYHNATCMPEAKKLQAIRSRALLPPLPSDNHPLTPSEQFWRRLRNKFKRWTVK